MNKIKNNIKNKFNKKNLFSVLFAFSLFFNSNPKIIQNQNSNPIKIEQIANNNLATSNTKLASKTNEFAIPSTKLARTVTAFQKTVTTPTINPLTQALNDLLNYLKGSKSEVLIMLMASSLIPALAFQFGFSSILGFLIIGTLLGPHGLAVIKDIHTIEKLGDLGIVFFLFEMGVELSTERLLQMKKDVFGLGLSQFLGTMGVIGAVCSIIGKSANLSNANTIAASLTPQATIVIGGAMALSSSAFVLQLLKDRGEMGTRGGKASFGVLLFQDLAVVPLLVSIPLLAPGGGSMSAAIFSASLKAMMSLVTIATIGKTLMNPAFTLVAKAKSQEAFLGMILLTVLSMSFLTEGLGLSNTLGAFLAGVLLSETKYRYQIEADIAPFRGILLGLFFTYVGLEIDPRFMVQNLGSVVTALVGLLALKSSVLLGLTRFNGLSKSASIQTSLLLAQSGEFAFVAFGMAKSFGILSPKLTKLLMTTVALSMALTPALADFGGKISKKLEQENTDFSHYLGQDREATEITSSAEKFVVVVGYGTVGKIVCDLLDKKFIKYVGLEVDPTKAIQARNKGLPVFYGDISRNEVAETFGVDRAAAVILTISESVATNKAVISLRRNYPDLEIFARAKDRDHRKQLENVLKVQHAVMPFQPEDNLLISLPFGGEVLRSLGSNEEEVNVLLAEMRRELEALKNAVIVDTVIENKMTTDTSGAVIDVEKEEEESTTDIGVESAEKSENIEEDAETEIVETA